MDEINLEQRARELLAIEYERGGQYPTYADMARTSSGLFTQCAIRAVKAALKESTQRATQEQAMDAARRTMGMRQDSAACVVQR